MPFLGVDKYQVIVERLLKKHDLNVTRNSAESLSKLIVFRRRRAAKELTNKKYPSATKGIEKAITHTLKLIEYAGRKHTRRSDKKKLVNSIKKRRSSLNDALENPYVMVELSLRQPRVDVNELLDKNTLSPDTLAHLLKCLTGYIEDPKPILGRPRDTKALIFASAVQTWVSAGRKERYTYSEITEQIKGPFIDFLRDLFDLCDLQIPGDPAIKSRLTQPKNLFDAMQNRNF